MTGFIIVPLWLVAMTWLVAHDVWPGLTAHPAPPLQVTDWLRSNGLETEYAIHDDLGRLGTVWSRYLLDERSVRRDDLIWIDRLPVNVTPMRITVHSVFTAEGLLDEFTLRLQNHSADVKLHGERFHADFSFTLESGPIEKTFKLPITSGDVVSGAFNPFSSLTNLHVGQRWRMQVVNPIACLTGIGRRFIPMLVEVTGEERITTPDGDHNCFVVESSHAKAWVDAHGAVIVQEMTLPIVGTIRMVRQAVFDNEARIAARKRRL